MAGVVMVYVGRAESAQDRLTDREADLERTRLLLDSTNRDLVAARREHAAVALEGTGLAIRLEESTDRTAELRSDLDMLRRTLSGRDGELRDARAATDLTSAKLSALEVQMDDLRSQLHLSRDEGLRLRSLLDQVRFAGQDADVLKLRLDELKNTLSASAQQLNAESVAREEWEKKAQTLERKNQDLLASIASFEAEQRLVGELYGPAMEMLAGTKDGLIGYYGEVEDDHVEDCRFMPWDIEKGTPRGPSTKIPKMGDIVRSLNFVPVYLAFPEYKGQEYFPGPMVGAFGPGRVIEIVEIIQFGRGWTGGGVYFRYRFVDRAASRSVAHPSSIWNPISSASPHAAR